MKIEIAICTWNRARLLQQTLESISQAVTPPGAQVHVIVVNNNSTDNTPAVVKSFHDKLSIEIIDEPKQGHCFSRNRAINCASGDMLLWTDDDVLVSKDWIQAYFDAATGQSESSFWGGPINPVFESGKPKWVEENWEKLSGCFAARDLGVHAKPFDTQTLPYGANFAIRTAIQKQFLFSEELGRQKNSVLGEDELQMLRRVLAAGHAGQWQPSAKLDHVIDRTRCTRGYVQRYFIGQGRALVGRDQQWHDDVAELKREARHHQRMYRSKMLFTQSDVWVSHLIRAALAHGQAMQLPTK